MASPGAARAADPDRIGGRYLVEATLGKGGMGAVYRVLDEASGRRLALKQMTWFGDDPAPAQLRFRREFHTMASLKHPRVVEVHDYGAQGGVPFYTMELLDGQDLHDLSPVPARRACELLRDVAAALGFLHARRLLHRDLAPRNVRCTSDGRAKLIDFGVLATAGVSGEIAGTPPFIAPETLRGLPLDHRADLFGLGALAYKILTGRQAYPAREVDQLEQVWRDRPAPPSALAEDIPPALDELVLSLLAQDPLGRPANAAAVMDRLAAIGGLDPAPEVETTRGWLASAALVGRQRETSQIRRAVARAVDGNGRSVLIEAPSGTGKSRLLRELGLEAQLAGMQVVRAESEAAGRGPYGIFHELARALLGALPEEAQAAARPRARVLARVITSLRTRLDVKPAEPLGDPAEDRMLLQSELSAWVIDLAARRPLALLVDDVQRCDEASAAVLATLAHSAEGKTLLVGAALRTDETVRAPAAVASLCDAGQRLRLRGLEAGEVEALCRGFFGDVPHVARLAKWMHRIAGGSPLHSTELARHFVDRGVIRYLDGLWVIPEEPGRDDLPLGLAEAMDARVRALPERARALGEALSVHGGELPLDLVVHLGDTEDEEAVFGALDQLTYEEVLVQSGDSWRFRHDGLREALLRQLAPERKRALHRRVGEALSRSGAAGPEHEAEIGWHLLHGGDAERGAALLEEAGRRLYDAQSFSDCIAPLEAALAAKRGGSARVRLEVLHMLLMSGCMADRKTALRHADACVQGFRYWAGVDVAAGCRSIVGRHLGLVVGLFWATLRWIFTPRRGPNPLEAFRTFFVVVGYAATVHALAFDLEKVKPLVALADPIAIFRKRVPYAVYLLTRNLYHYPRGDTATVRRNCRRLLEILHTDRVTPIREIDRKTGEGGARYMLLLLALSNLEPEWREELAALAELKLRFYEIGAEQALVVYHRMRGEEELATEIEARTEVLFVQLGSVWQMESFIPVISSLAYAFARDVLGLKRTIEELVRLCGEGFQYEVFAELARAEYLRERGDPRAALALLRPLCARDDFPLLRLPALPALAESYLALGEYARAREAAEEGVRAGRDLETGNLHAKMRSLRALALAEASMGRLAEAARILDEALAEASPYGSPLLSGSLHEARARVALLAGDAVTYEQHRVETDHLFRATRNPALVARGDRLAEAAERQARATSEVNPFDPPTSPSSPSSRRREKEAEVSVVAGDAVTTPQPDDPRPWVSAVLSGCRGGAERAARSLELIVNAAQGASGYLYLRHHGALELAAPTWGDEPPALLQRELARSLEDKSEATTVADVERPDGQAGRLDWRPVPLVAAVGETRVIVGGVAVVAGALPLVEPDPRLVDEIARELFEAGDVTRTRTVT